MTTTNKIISHSPEETHRLAADLLRTLGPGSVLALHGELGAGKTCFVQGLAKALNIPRAVNSPTFTLINEYPGRPPLYHIDLYRIQSPEEALNLGLDDYIFGKGITAIEWAERIADILPPSTTHIFFENRGAPEERVITIKKGRAA